MAIFTHVLVYPTVQRIVGICRGGGVTDPQNHFLDTAQILLKFQIIVFNDYK